jgi:hypothetical protein
MTSQIKYNAEFDLTVPTGDILKSIIADVVITPASGSVLIYGMTSPETLEPIQVNGSKSKLELPFINGKIYVTFLGNTTDCSFVTHGWKDSLI